MQYKTVTEKNKIIKLIKNRKIYFSFVAFLSALSSIGGMFSPFGVACCSAFLKHRFSAIYSALFIFGYIINDINLFFVPEILTVIILSLLSFKFATKKYWSLLSYICYLVIKLLFSFYYEISIFEFVRCALESVGMFVFSNFYFIFIKYFNNDVLRKTVNQNEFTSITVIFLVSLCALSDVYLPLEITFSGVILIFLVLYIAYEFPTPVCALTGIIAGITAGLNSPETLYTVASFSVSTVFSSLCKKYSRLGVILSFIASNAIFTLMVNGSEEILINLYEVLIAGGILLIIPIKKLDEIKNNIMILMHENNSEVERMNIIKTFTDKRLKKLSVAFDNISSLLLNENKTNKYGLENNVESMTKTVIERVCKNCKGCKRCWINNKENNFKVIKDLFYTSEKRGWVEQYDLPSSFKEICFQTQLLIVETNKVYELFRMNKIWESKARENKMLISQQFGTISRVTSNLAEELNEQCGFRRDMEKNIISELDLLGIRALNATVIRLNSRHLFVKITVKFDGRRNQSDIIKVTESVLGRRMKIVNSSNKNSVSYYDLAEKELFEAETGISRIRPDKDKNWGDNYSIIRPDGEKVIIALSDGMGTGDDAGKESKDTVNLLEKLLAAGIDKSIAIKLINSVLILKSFDECFATIDMLIFDVYSGEGEFIKTGGVSSYILRKDAVTEICSGSLPAGIVNDAESSSYKTTLKDGDVVLILSDGVTDINADDNWIKDCLRVSKDLSAKQIADSIMERACRQISICQDDMTVIAVKINSK